MYGSHLRDSAGSPPGRGVGSGGAQAEGLPGWRGALQTPPALTPRSGAIPFGLLPGALTDELGDGLDLVGREHAPGRTASRPVHLSRR